MERTYVIRIYDIMKGVPKLTSEMTKIPQTVIDMIYSNKDLTIDVVGEKYETAVILMNGKMTTIISEDMYTVED